MRKKSDLLKAEIKSESDRTRRYPFFRYSGVDFAVNEKMIRIGKKTRAISRGAIKTGEGANVLPYVFLKDAWHVVLVEQFRLAIDAVTYEAPGGILEGDAKQSMARELKEEADIEVNPEDIEIRFREYYLPSLLEGSAWGGIIEIQPSQLPGNLNCGLALESEYTFVRVLPLDEIQILKSQFSGKAVFDLWTSRLLDEVAKKVERF